MKERFFIGRVVSPTTLLVRTPCPGSVDTNVPEGALVSVFCWDVYVPASTGDSRRYERLGGLAPGSLDLGKITSLPLFGHGFFEPVEGRYYEFRPIDVGVYALVLQRIKKALLEGELERFNPALQEEGWAGKKLTWLILEEWARAVCSRSSDRELAASLVDVGTQPTLLRKLKEEVERFLDLYPKLKKVVAPIGSGRFHARDGGGRIGRVFLRAAQEELEARLASNWETIVPWYRPRNAREVLDSSLIIIRNELEGAGLLPVPDDKTESTTDSV